MENTEKEKSIEQFRNHTIAMMENLRKINFDVVKAGIAESCMTNLSVVKNIINTDIVCGEDGSTLETIINDGNNEIKKVIDSVFITDEELDEIKKGLLGKLNFEMSRGEFILYQKISEMATAYFAINSISNTTKNSLLYNLHFLINQDKK